MPESKNPAKVEKTHKLCFLKTPKDSKVLEIKTGLCKASLGSYLSGNDRRLAVAIAVFSPKAESIN